MVVKIVKKNNLVIDVSMDITLIMKLISWFAEKVAQQILLLTQLMLILLPPKNV